MVLVYDIRFPQHVSPSCVPGTLYILQLMIFGADKKLNDGLFSFLPSPTAAVTIFESSSYVVTFSLQSYPTPRKLISTPETNRTHKSGGSRRDVEHIKIIRTWLRIYSVQPQVCKCALQSFVCFTHTYRVSTFELLDKPYACPTHS